jgi:hypothetical protein
VSVVSLQVATSENVVRKKMFRGVFVTHPFTRPKASTQKPSFLSACHPTKTSPLITNTTPGSWQSAAHDNCSPLLNPDHLLFRKVRICPASSF